LRFGWSAMFTLEVVFATKGRDTIFRASYGEGFKVPSLYQLFSDYGNSSMNPETSTSYDAGVTQLLVGGKLELSATVFRRTGENLINFINCPVSTRICTDRPFGVYYNIDRTKAQGVEMSLLAPPVEAQSWSL